MSERKLGFFVQIKEGENFNRRNTLSISRIYPPPNLGGLKFESDADMGEKDSFRSGTKKGDWTLWPQPPSLCFVTMRLLLCDSQFRL